MKKKDFNILLKEIVTEVLNTISDGSNNSFDSAAKEYEKWELNFLKKSAPYWGDVLRRGQEEVANQLSAHIFKLPYVQQLGSAAKDFVDVMSRQTATKMYQQTQR